MDMEKLLQTDVKVNIGHDKYAARIDTGNHQLVADEPVTKGGQDTGPAPYQLLLASLGSCTVITVKMYAERKGWDLQSVDVSLNMEQETTTEGKHTVFLRRLQLQGNLTDEQRQHLLKIAEKCPVAKLLTGKIEITSQLA
jgi:putative redox protein